MSRGASEGYYRPITQTFINDVRTRLISPLAFRALIVLKVLIGPTGIEQRYGLRTMLMNYLLPPLDGTEEGAMEEVLSELEQWDFIRRDGAMVWVLDQLREDPNSALPIPLIGPRCSGTWPPCRKTMRW